MDGRGVEGEDRGGEPCRTPPERSEGGRRLALVEGDLALEGTRVRDVALDLTDQAGPGIGAEPKQIDPPPRWARSADRDLGRGVPAQAPETHRRRAERDPVDDPLLVAPVVEVPVIDGEAPAEAERGEEPAERRQVDVVSPAGLEARHARLRCVRPLGELLLRPAGQEPRLADHRGDPGAQQRIGDRELTTHVVRCTPGRSSPAYPRGSAVGIRPSHPLLGTQPGVHA